MMFGMGGKSRGTVLVGLVVLAGALFLFSQGPTTNRRYWPAQFESNGERIYFTGTNSSGQAITSRGGDMHMGMMTAGGCIACHGSDRQGGRLMHRFWQVVPAVTSTALFGKHADGGNEAAHGDHDVYTNETLGRAITQGIDPSGKPLDPAMPRWSMSVTDLSDLISYLKGPEAKSQ